jgi:hypothetical protein
VSHLQHLRQHMQSHFDLPSSPLRCGQPDKLRQHEPLCPSYPTCASVASACGSQKVMSMARYSAMAVSRAARACCRRPVCARASSLRLLWSWSSVSAR